MIIPRRGVKQLESGDLNPFYNDKEFLFLFSGSFSFSNGKRPKKISVRCKVIIDVDRVSLYFSFHFHVRCVVDPFYCRLSCPLLSAQVQQTQPASRNNAQP